MFKQLCRRTSLIVTLFNIFSCDFQSQQYAVELAEILVEKNVDKIKNMFDGRLSFGTAGLRGAMSPGFKRMNDLVVVQSAQGLLYYMLSVFGDSLKTSGIIIGYDGRYNSRRLWNKIPLNNVNFINCFKSF